MAIRIVLLILPIDARGNLNILFKNTAKGELLWMIYAPLLTLKPLSFLTC